MATPPSAFATASIRLIDWRIMSTLFHGMGAQFPRAPSNSDSAGSQQVNGNARRIGEARSSHPGKPRAGRDRVGMRFSSARKIIADGGMSQFDAANRPARL